MAYWRGRCIEEAKLPAGGMAAVGMTWDEAIARCPDGVVPACHNAHDTITISGALTLSVGTLLFLMMTYRGTILFLSLRVFAFMRISFVLNAFIVQ